ncbi:LysR family transcriptional regulator [Alteromonas sediminis]|uniref:LysR family transcriptional regulator n=1 Tax=Alteromonas sediminis TaxID=2259342 RepID=A0A3N5Y0B8_9ALTE|nr:LysR family transcriptional regulator [Alteromonas sediminis]RPJ66500.1 LysR family transcriptional regulator [Alteromonas sediminis]
MNDFEGLVEFIAVAECKGFTKAAQQLRCSTSHVSKQMVKLEQRLGVALLARTTRVVNLTREGEVYYHKARDLLNGLHQANDAIGTEQQKLTGTLRVSAAGTFAESFLASALIEFGQQHPELNIHLIFDSKLINFVDEGFDFSVRVGLLKDSGLIARKLVDRSVMLVASPDYLARKGTPKTPHDLKQHDCIVNNDTWNFSTENGIESVKLEPRFKSNNASVMTQACLNGFGITYLPKSNFRDAIEKGDLVPIMEPYWLKDISSWIVYQNRQYLPAKARITIDYLLAYFADWQE